MGGRAGTHLGTGQSPVLARASRRELESANPEGAACEMAAKARVISAATRVLIVAAVEVGRENGKGDKERTDGSRSKGAELRRYKGT